MKIENSDIDCLIDISVFLKGLADHPEDCRYKKNFADMHYRIRKVYILLLNSCEKGQKGLDHLVKKGIANDSVTARALKYLCPTV